MDCDWDGSCYEAVMLETCDCQNAAVFTTTQFNFKVIIKNLSIQLSFQSKSIHARFQIDLIWNEQEVICFYFHNSSTKIDSIV